MRFGPIQRKLLRVLDRSTLALTPADLAALDELGGHSLDSIIRSLDRLAARGILEKSPARSASAPMLVIRRS